MDTQEKSVYTALLIVLTVLGLIFLYIILSFVRQQRRQRSLHLSKVETEIRTLDNERRRIAAELHEGVGSTLSAIKLKLESMTGIAANDQRLIAEATGHIIDVSVELREIANGLMPGTLLKKGVIHALEEFIDHLPQHKMLVEFKHDLQLKLPAEYAVHLYRIVQEIIHNTLKHADASRLLIVFESREETLLVKTADNGRGFRYGQKQAGGVGLMNLQSRVDVMKGEFKVETKPGKGTRMIIEIPLLKNRI